MGSSEELIDAVAPELEDGPALDDRLARERYQSATPVPPEASDFVLDDGRPIDPASEKSSYATVAGTNRGGGFARRKKDDLSAQSSDSSTSVACPVSFSSFSLSAGS